LEKPFDQKEGAVYWLNVAARPRDGSDWMWGWETSQEHWNDNAVQGDGVWWKAMGQPQTAFEDLPLGATYFVGQTLTTAGMPITVRPFQWSNLTWTSDGHTRVATGGNAGGAGKELAVNNVNLDMGFGFPLQQLSLLFGEYGGNLNIEINGVFKNFDNLADIDGQTIGGVDIEVVNGLGNDHGFLRLVGTINQFAIGGQEFFIDNVDGRGEVDMAFALITPQDEDYCEGDFDRDGDVDIFDLERFAAHFGRPACYLTGDCEGDFDYDGDQDGRDLSKFIEDYGRDDCPCPLPEPCDDGVPCTVDFIDPETGACRHEPKNCDDRNPCTLDGCDPDTGRCLHEPICEACCLPEGTCRQITIDECLELQGRPQGGGSECQNIQCPPPEQASVGDFVWEDLNGNGLQDSGEPGLAGVTVELLDCNGNVLAVTTTDASGFYAFTAPPGDYNLHLILLPGFLFSLPDQGMDDQRDSDADPVSGMTVCTNLAPAETDLTWDAGMFRLQPGIDIQKSTNGQDADVAPGPSIPVGDAVLWEYVVTNTGNVPLTDITVTDDQGVTVACPNSNLPPGEVMTCTASGFAVHGPYANVGTARGATAGGIIVSYEDPSHYTGLPAPEACCLPSGECAELPPAECRERSGEPQGPRSDCNNVQCPPPTEACIIRDQGCFDLPQEQCLENGGDPQGPGTTCNR
ncbi:MAG: hypothetical protein JSW39_26790, partial [Desulfobacterales bacterium]